MKMKQKIVEPIPFGQQESEGKAKLLVVGIVASMLTAASFMILLSTSRKALGYVWKLLLYNYYEWQ